MLNEHELKEIEARCAAATPSNLRLMDDGIIIEDDGSVIADFGSKHDDARLFIHARTDIPDLLAHIREAIQVLPRDEYYVNVHPYCLHLWAEE